MRARLGVNTCFAVKRWPLPSEWAAIVRDDLGLDAVELSLDSVPGLDDPSLREATVAGVRDAVDRHGLELTATFTGLSAYSFSLLMHPDAGARASALRWYRRIVDATAELGARGTGGHVGAMSVADRDDPALREERWSQLREALAELAAHARRRGLDHLLVENLAAAREPSTMADIESLVTAGDAEHVPIRLCLDVGHHCVPGTSGDERDPHAWLRRFGATAAEIQLQQSDAEGDHHWPFTAPRNAEGRIDAGRVLDTLRDAGAAEVLLVLEVIPPFEQDDGEVVRDLRDSVEYWRAAIGAHAADG